MTNPCLTFMRYCRQLFISDHHRINHNHKDRYSFSKLLDISGGQDPEFIDKQYRSDQIFMEWAAIEYSRIDPP